MLAELDCGLGTLGSGWSHDRSMKLAERAAWPTDINDRAALEALSDSLLLRRRMSLRASHNSI
jgi:hypothetical protein